MSKKGQETRTYIRKKAYELFAEKGFKEVTMKDICEITNLSRGGLYRHYNSPCEIFAEILEELMKAQENEFTSKIDSGISAIQILDEVLERYQAEMIDSENSLSIAIYEYYSHSQRGIQNNALSAQYHFSEKMWIELIQYGIKTKAFKNINTKAVFDLIVFSYQGVRMYSKLMPIEPEIPKRIIQQIKEILIN